MHSQKLSRVGVVGRKMAPSLGARHAKRTRDGECAGSKPDAQTDAREVTIEVLSIEVSHASQPGRGTAAETLAADTVK